MKDTKPQAKKNLPPYTGDLRVVEIVKTGDSLGLKPLGYCIEIENARGNFNEFLSTSAEFNTLATESGKRFSALASR